MGDGQNTNWESTVRREPQPVEVARLCASHGFEAACERWSQMSSRKVYTLAEQGRRELAKIAARTSPDNI